MPFSKEAKRIFREWDDGPPAPQNLIDKMQSQAIANSVLGRPGPEREALDRIEAMPRDEFEAEFADAPDRDAYDEEAAMGPPPPERVARRAREVYEAKVRRDDEAWERRRAERKAEA